MPAPSSHRLRLATLLGACLAGLMACGSAAPAEAHTRAAPPRPPVTAHTDYLALGDSLSFGYRDPGTVPTPDYHEPSTFVGFPELLGAALGLVVANPSCVGETTGSFIDADVQSNGCESSVADRRRVDSGYRTEYPLHVRYRGSQLAYAEAYLESHRRTTLVSLQLGANDVYLCEAVTADDCRSQFAATLRRVRTNLATILGDIRHRAGYSGQIVVVDYFSVDYADGADDRATTAVDDAINAAARPYGVEIAPVYQDFRAATAAAGYDNCKAGLMTVLAAGGCGTHPDRKGQEIVARAVEAVITR